MMIVRAGSIEGSTSGGTRARGVVDLFERIKRVGACWSWFEGSLGLAWLAGGKGWRSLYYFSSTVRFNKNSPKYDGFTPDNHRVHGYSSRRTNHDVV